MHDAGYAHMDLKLENILISDEGHLKLCDFGLASKTDRVISKAVGTENYMAPEMNHAFFEPVRDVKKTDIFSLGVIFFIMAFGTPPIGVAK